MCCLYGMIDYGNTFSGKDKHHVLKVLSSACEDRGTDATGYAHFNGNTLAIQKAPKPAHKTKFHIPDGTTFIMGHTRLTTQGSEKQNYNNHPFEGRAGGEVFSLAHNGVLSNDVLLRREHKLPPTKIETDSYVAVQLLEKLGAVTFDSMRNVAEQLNGSFTLTAMTQQHFYFIKGNNPLCIYHYPALRLYLYASTEEILRKGIGSSGLLSVSHEDVQICSGDILRIDTRGKQKMEQFDNRLLLNHYYSRFMMPSWNDCRYYAESYPDDYMEQLKFFGTSMGIPEIELDLLIDFGYDPLDIEEMIYDPELLQCCMQEIYCG